MSPPRKLMVSGPGLQVGRDHKYVIAPLLLSTYVVVVLTSDVDFGSNAAGQFRPLKQTLRFHICGKHVWETWVPRLGA